MQKSLILIGMLMTLPFAAHAKNCIDFDENMNVVEYDCNNVPNNTKSEHDNQTTQDFLSRINVFVRGAYGFNISESWSGNIVQESDDNIYAAVGLRLPIGRNIFYDFELAGSLMPTKAHTSGTYFAPQLSDSHIFNIMYLYEYSLDAKMYNLMLNAHIGIMLNQKMSTYSGLGIGYARITGDTKLIGGSGLNVTETESSNGYLVRLLLGIEYEIGYNIALFGEYAYTTQWIDIADAATQNYMHNLLLGVKYSF